MERGLAISFSNQLVAGECVYRLYQLWLRLAPVIPARPVTIPTFLVDQKNSFVFVDDVAKVVIDAVEAGPDNDSFADQVAIQGGPKKCATDS